LRLKDTKLLFATNHVDNPGGATYFFGSKLGRTNLSVSTDNSLKRPLSNLLSMKIHEPGRIIDTKYKNITYSRAVEKVKEAGLLPENEEFILRFMHDARLGKTILKKQKKKIGDKRLFKYAQDLRKLDSYFKKPLDKVTQYEMEQFILDLEEGRLLSNKGKPFAPETQVCFKKMIRKFYKWLLGDNKHFPDLVVWIDTSCDIKEFKSVSFDDFKKGLSLMPGMKSNLILRDKTANMVLFDGGLRADELLNTRLKHLTEENGIYKLRIEFSKSKKRTLSLPLASELLGDWLKLHPMANEPEAQLFPVDYKSLYKIVRKVGKVLGVKLTPHGIRHSSATYWASRLNQYQMCYRFGWSMSSKQPQRYIDRQGLEQEEIVQVVQQEKSQKLKQENELLKNRLAMLEERFESLFEKDKTEILKMYRQVNNAFL
jgi:integrase